MENCEVTNHVGVSKLENVGASKLENVGVSLRARSSVLVGISYGVDSFVAKNLLKEKGFEVHECNLDIESAQFKKIKKHFVDNYINALTPNICTYCNRHFKFFELNKKREELNLDYYATGHYANVIFKDGRYAIKKSKNASKDQSYMLYNLTQEELMHLILPISDMDKSDVRKLAATYEGEVGKEYAEKKDSLDICFIQNKSYVEYIKEYFLGENYKEKLAAGKLTKEDLDKYYFLRRGRIVKASDIVGAIDNVGANCVSPHVIAYHDGIINFTIGQRLYIDAQKTDLYVKWIDKNTLDVVVDKKENLYVSEFDICDINYMLLKEMDGLASSPLRRKRNSSSPLQNNCRDEIAVRSTTYRGGYSDSEVIITANVKTTYRGDEVKCECTFTKGNVAHIKLHTPLIVSKGQAAVFYDDEGVILFGGVIK